jgi:HEAT repeat protein
MHDHTQMVTAWHALEGEVSKFRAWVDSLPDDTGTSAWEAGYEGWHELHTAGDNFVSTTSCAYWATDMIHVLLYVLARDTDTGYLVRAIARSPENLLCLAEYGVTDAEPDAKYQLAAELGCLKQLSQRTEPLLLRFAHDDDEYVRRRALLALADINSPHVTDLVSAAWNTGVEHARMAVLNALQKIHDPQLEDYLKLAEADGREYLVRYANKIRAGEPVA